MRLLLILSLAASMQAATYYVSPGGNDGNSCTAAQSSATAKATFSSSWGCLSAGDTLIVRDGSYNQQIAPPQGKAGSATAAITLRAENDGAAKITLPNTAFIVNNSYLTFQGLAIVGASNAGAISINSGTGSGGSSATASHHITLQRMGIRCPLTSSVNDNVCLEVSSGAHHNVIEDSWIWGGGRYEVMAYGRDNNGNTTVTGADNNVFRRLVIRQGPNVSGGGQPQAGIMMYYANNNTIENVIVLDSTPTSDSSNAAFYLSAHATPPNVSGNKYLGVIALNIKGNKGTGIYIDVDNGGVSSNNEIRDSVVWNVAGEALPMYNQHPGNCTGIVVDHVTVGGGSDAGFGWSNCSVSLTNSIITQSRGAAIVQGTSGGSVVSNYNILYGNGGTYSNAKAGANDLTSNPLLSYLGRIDASTPAYRTASDGSNRGADITHRYVNGVKTTTSLWPWPNEARIKKEMCADSGITTGFCASSNLTSYIWGYLGKPVPADISSALPPPPPPPASPCDLTSDNLVNQGDVTVAVAQVIGESACASADIQKNGVCNVVDLQRVINASQGQGCNVNP